MAPFYGWGSTASRLEPLQGGSLLFTTMFPEIPGKGKSCKVLQQTTNVIFSFSKTKNKLVMTLILQNKTI